MRAPNAQGGGSWVAHSKPFRRNLTRAATTGADFEEEEDEAEGASTLRFGNNPISSAATGPRKKGLFLLSKKSQNAWMHGYGTIA